MDKSDELLERCFKCKSYQKDECGIYFMMALWQKECPFFKKYIVMTKYQEMLEEVGIIPEDFFNDIIASFPNCDLDFSEFELDDLLNCTDICNKIINCNLTFYSYVYADNIDWDRKTFELNDVESLSNLEEIKNKFPKWTISNYDEIVKDLKESLVTEENYSKKSQLFHEYVDNVPYEDLEKFLTQYDKK